MSWFRGEYRFQSDPVWIVCRERSWNQHKTVTMSFINWCTRFVVTRIASLIYINFMLQFKWKCHGKSIPDNNRLSWPFNGHKATVNWISWREISARMEKQFYANAIDWHWLYIQPGLTLKARHGSIIRAGKTLVVANIKWGSYSANM